MIVLLEERSAQPVARGLAPLLVLRPLEVEESHLDPMLAAKDRDADERYASARVHVLDGAGELGKAPTDDADSVAGT